MSVDPDEKERTLERVETRSLKQLNTMMSSIDQLKGNDYDSFLNSILNLSRRFQWHESLLTLEEVKLTKDGDIDLTKFFKKDDQVGKLKYNLDNNNLYAILINKTRDHPVESLIKNRKFVGRGREAFLAVNNYFRRQTMGGRNNAMNNFQTITMANSNTNFLEYAAKVERLGDLVNEMGGNVGEYEKINILLKGLLPQFEPIKIIINNANEDSYEQVKNAIFDFSENQGLTELRKGGGRNHGPNVFFVQNQCRNWSRYKCTYGEKCKFKHEGPGGCIERKTKSKENPKTSIQENEAEALILQTNPDKQKSRCLACYEHGHSWDSCPIYADDDDCNHDYEEKIDPIFTCQTHDVPKEESFFEQFLLNGQMLFTGIIGLLSLFCFLIPTQICKMIAKNKIPIILLLVALVAVKACGTPSGATVLASSFFNSTSANPNEICSDSGTNRWVTHDMNDYIPGTIVYQTTKVAVGNGYTTSPCYGMMVIVDPKVGVPVGNEKALFLPLCSKKLVPASDLVKLGYSVTYNKHGVQVINRDGKVVLQGPEQGGLYFFNCEIKRDIGGCKDIKSAKSFFGLPTGSKPTSGTKEFFRKLYETHCALGHLHFDKVRKIFNLGKGNNPECTICAAVKSKRSKLGQSASYSRSQRINDRVHMDIGFAQDVVFQLYVDDYTRKSHLDILKSKANSFEAYIDYKTKVEAQFVPHKIAKHRTDSENIYTTQAWEDHRKDNGIVHECSPRYRHDANGVVESAMRAIGIPFRCMMVEGSAPASDIPYALNQANVIRNNSPTRANGGWTPNEREAGTKLSFNARLSKAPIFCLAFAHVYEEERSYKGANRGVPCVYLGFDDVNNVYYVKDWKSGRIYCQGDVTFHSNTFPYRSDPNRVRNWIHQYDDIAPHTLSQVPLESGDSNSTRARKSKRIEGYQSSEGVPLTSIPDKDISPQNYIIHDFGPDPTNWRECMDSKFAEEWIQAKELEKQTFKNREVLELVPRSEVRGKIFKGRVVYKMKINPPDDVNHKPTLEKCRYRLTIAAFRNMMTQGIDYTEKFASTVRWNSIRMLIAIAVKFDYDICLFDMKAFFLYGDLDKKVYLEIPDGWHDGPLPEGDWVYEVKKGMYGLPQAAHAAQKKLNYTLTKDGVIRKTTSDDCIYVTKGKNAGDPSYSAVGAHVDDLVAIGDESGLKNIADTLKATFEITIRKNPTVITGVQIERKREKGWLKLHQADYISNLLKKYNMLDCKPALTPIDPGMARSIMLLQTSDHPDPTVLRRYQGLVGELIWPYTHTRPDLSIVVNILSRFLKCATEQHLKIALGRPLRYLRGTIDHGIVYQPGKEEWVLSGSSDSDFAGDIATSRSTSGMCTKLGKFGLISYNSSLERKISTSTGQAETYAMGSLAKEMVWERHMARELGIPQKGPSVLRTDNNGVFKQSTKAVNHTSAKHYRVTQAYIRGLVDEGEAKVEKINTEDNEADPMTKALPPHPFLTHKESYMGPQTI